MILLNTSQQIVFLNTINGGTVHMYLSEKFRSVGGNFNSDIYRVLVEMDSKGIELNQNDKEFTNFIKSIAVELSKMDKLEIGMRALENINKNNELK